ncbi:histidine kinase dimerization/phosphoacceptor domain -containing protein [Maribacter sp. SA7]|uniref:sensor histidine kinase n=1 Tax=Maribacter zhoushanensis TaxID=3030012 RepID=UPI0023EAA912|nr:histidine kinase dimerization/phosphoacceptor domain -containing protein [Maribacter zhoushanensis]MDF4202474.1 histidine kinase dimerization/phosphoacceptor domain -containing protein [Maribacter zhoushanensis]
MPGFTIDKERLQDKTKLFLRVNYTTSIISILFGALCYFFLNITEIIPFALTGFAILNIINLLYFRSHKNIVPTFNFSSIIGLITAVVVTVYSGGIHSPFIFMIPLIAFGGFINSTRYGRVYFNIITILILLVFTQSIPELRITENLVPEETSSVFSLVSILFAVFILGNTLGKTLLKTYNAMYKSKRALANQVHEKENLLKEVHHRVKNNLQTVSSLLSLQSRNIETGPMKGLLKGTQNRVIAMAMVHEMLYMRNDISHIEYKSYVLELGEYLIKSIKGNENNVSLKIDIPDIKLGIDTAIPLGLLINETLTNALKYGIESDNVGEISIKLQKDTEQENCYILEIGDNGIGFPETINHKNTKSLGLKLIHNLTRQLRGTIERDNSKKGTNYIIKFQEIKQQLSPVA